MAEFGRKRSMKEGMRSGGGEIDCQLIGEIGLWMNWVYELVGT